MYLDRAGATQKVLSSGTTPLPIGVGKNGILNFSINLLIGPSAPEYDDPEI